MTPAESAERARLVAAVESEEELDGEMPHDMWTDICESKEVATEYLRAVVRATKRNILARVLASFDAAHKEEG